MSLPDAAPVPCPVVPQPTLRPVAGLDAAILRRSMVAVSAVAVLALAGGWPAEAGAERADRSKPLKYEADGGRADDKQGLVQLRGNVVISKGTLEIRADRVELVNGKQGQSATASGTAAVPATFRQKRDGVDEYMEGQAQRIEYDVRNETVRFFQQAVLRRVRGGVVSDEISGQSITYDNVAESFEVQGAAPAAAASVPASGRVRGVLAPREEPAEKKPAEKSSSGEKR
jgi:lipopolysaccharide export system protein LptA